MREDNLTVLRPDEPIVVNGIRYTNKSELEKRREADAEALAQLLYDIYKQEKNRSLKSLKLDPH